LVTLDEIRAAQQRIRTVALRTPLTRLGAPREGRAELYLKLENLQPIGSFKLRGAYNTIASLTEDERRHGVITYSSGNHAQGVAYGARAVGVKAVVVMPRTAPAIKAESTRALGAEVVFVGPASSERQARAEELAREHGYYIVPPFNDQRIIAGQGTIGLELLEDLSDLDAVVVPIGGGGLISGIGAALKQLRPQVRVIGVEPDVANDAQQSLRTGRHVTLPAEQTARTIADGLRTQSIGEINYEHIRHFVDDIVTVSDDEMRQAMRRLLLTGRILAEPSGAASAAAFFFHSGELGAVSRVAAIISGGNADPALVREVLA
jgi:threonine dehydratase